MRIRQMGNTKIDCLHYLRDRGQSTPLQIATWKWAGTKQPGKKAETVRRHLKQLARTGFVLNVGDCYFLTETGKLAAADATQQKRPIMLTLARR